MHVNRLTLCGNVGSDPEFGETEKGIKIAKFSLASDETWVDDNGERQKWTEWTRISAFGPVAQIIEDKGVKKGCEVHLEGKKRTMVWTDDETGKKGAAVTCNPYYIKVTSFPKEVDTAEMEKQRKDMEENLDIVKNGGDTLPF